MDLSLVDVENEIRKAEDYLFSNLSTEIAKTTSIDLVSRSNDAHDDADVSTSFDSTEHDLFQRVHEQVGDVYYASDLVTRRELNLNLKHEIEPSPPTDDTSIVLKTIRKKNAWIKEQVDQSTSRKSSVTKSADVKHPQETRTTRLRKALAQKKKSQTREQNTATSECTFKPKLTPYPSRKNYTRGNPRLVELSKSRQLVFASREKKKMEQEQAQIQQHCSFRPQLAKTNSSTNKTTTPNTCPKKQNHGAVQPQEQQEAVDRLHHEAERRTYEREDARRRLEEFTLARDCPFQPKINATTTRMYVDKTTDYRPIHERISELQRQKQEHIEALALAQAKRQAQACAFVPDICPKSRALVDRNSQQEELGETDENESAWGNVNERLAKDALKMNQKKIRLQEQHDQQYEHCFHPKLNENTQKIIHRKPEFQLDFVDRQSVMEHHQLLKQLEKQAKDCAEDPNQAPCTFVPHIGNASEILANSRQRRSLLSESTAERSTRLSQDDARRIRLQREAARDAYYAQFNYRPEINPISRSLGQASSIDVLSRSKSQSRESPRESSRSRSMGDDDDDDATTKTLDGERSTNHLSFRDPMQKIEAERQARERRLAERRRAQEYLELKDCTFHPQTSKRPNSNKTSRQTKPVVVRGLGRFLELKALQKQKDLALERREREVFHRPYRPRAFTVVEPFKLSHEDKAEERRLRRERHRHVLEQQEMSECTFQPATMESMNRKIIESLLQDEEDENPEVEYF